MRVLQILTFRQNANSQTLTKINTEVGLKTEVAYLKLAQKRTIWEEENTTFEVVFPSSEVVSPTSNIVLADFQGVTNKKSDPLKVAHTS